MRYQKKSHPKPKPLRKVKWTTEVTLWAGAAGMLLGFGAEIFWHGNSMFWMSGGAFAGGLVGVLCDTGLFLYRRFKARRAHAAQPHV
jgi:hypothetical protein